jgi:hypothetical protein
MIGAWQMYLPVTRPEGEFDRILIEKGRSRDDDASWLTVEMGLVAGETITR